MDVFLDAFEDDNYIEELRRTRPAPTKRWSWLSEEKLQREMEELINAGGMSLSRICCTTLGFYLVCEYLTILIMLMPFIHLPDFICML